MIALWEPELRNVKRRTQRTDDVLTFGVILNDKINQHIDDKGSGPQFIFHDNSTTVPYTLLP